MKLDRRIQIIFSILIIFLSAGCVTYIMYRTNSYPQGNDVYGHLFKIDALYNSIKEGVLYPEITSKWYNGIELFRYWPPMSYYFYCIFMIFTGGDIYKSYIVFTFLVYFIGGCGFILFGLREDRLAFCTTLGVLYFCLPDNMRVFFGEGNIPRIFITMLLPYFFFFLCEFLCCRMKYAIVPISLITTCIVFSHIMISAMLGVSSFLFISIYCIAQKEYKRGFILLVDLVCSYMMAGIMLIPGLIGGVVTQNSSASQETSSDWSQYAIISLNPTLRFSDLQLFYFGISLFLIMILGIITFRKDTLPGFLSCLIIYIGTTMIVLPIISVLPLSQVFWMIRFIPMAECLFMISFIYWDNLKKNYMMIFLTLIIIDSLISFRFIIYQKPAVEVQETDLEDKYLLSEAANITSNRLSILDFSNIGSYPSYFIVKGDNDIDYMFGWAYQGAHTISEIVSMNEAFENRYYAYVFDRLENYGCDTVVVKKDEAERGLEYLYEMSEKFGYDKIAENEYAIVYKKNIDYKYGTIYKYENACIGKSTEYLSYLYPSFLKLKNDYLDEYTYEDLCKYKKIYISGPDYKDGNKDYCEQLIQKLSDNGTKIYIDMNGLKTDESAGRNSILGVYAQSVTFTEKFPIITLDNGNQFRLRIDTEKYKYWRTVYFTNLKNPIRSAEYEDGKYLDYLGYSPNENIVFIGLNLVYYCAQNPLESIALYDFLDEVFEESREDVPDKMYVPINVSFTGDEIIIYSDYDNVDTNLSNLDCFESERDLGSETFVRVDKGETRIKIIYPHLKLSIIVSILGVIMCALIWRYVYRHYEQFDLEY